MGEYREETIIRFTTFFYSGSAVVKEISVRPFTRTTSFISGISCAFCGGRSHTSTDFFPSVFVLPVNLIS
jgi:hypothetical protein